MGEMFLIMPKDMLYQLYAGNSKNVIFLQWK